MHDEYTKERERSFIWMGLLFSFFIGFIMGGAAWVLFDSFKAGFVVWFFGFGLSLDVCFRGRNG